MATNLYIQGTHPNTTFTPTLSIDSKRSGRVVIGTEDGLFESGAGGYTWRAIGPRVAIRALAQSVASPDVWLAGTAGHGVLLSTDEGETWSPREVGATFYAVAFDPTVPQRMAAAGFETGLLVSTDGGESWRRQPLDVSAKALHSLAFDPGRAGRLWLGTVGEGVFFTDDLGATCHDAGLPETTIYALVFG